MKKIYGTSLRWNSKRLWTNIITALSLIGSMTGILELDGRDAKIVGVVAIGANIILQAFFNGDVNDNHRPSN